MISLSFSSLGGPAVVGEYFGANGHRGYEDRIYSHLGEYYLEKLRFQDAAASYQAFIELNPLHKASPHFSMRVIEIYEKGDFPKLVLEAKKQFAASYGLQSEYWRHFDIEESPEVRGYLKSNLERPGAPLPRALPERGARAGEARELRRGAALVPRLPDLVPAPSRRRPPSTTASRICCSRTRTSATAAREYERTAYDYPEHEKAAAAGYAAIYAHREQREGRGGRGSRRR